MLCAVKIDGPVAERGGQMVEGVADVAGVGLDEHVVLHASPAHR